MSTTSLSCSGTADASSNGASLDEMSKRMKEMGVDEELVDKFSGLLRRCNIFTMGALRSFHDSVDQLIGELYDDSVLGKLQAQGFLAMLRVRLYARRAHTLPRALPTRV